MHRLIPASVLAIVMAALPVAAQLVENGDTPPPTPSRLGTGSVAPGPTGAPDVYGVTGYSIFVVPPTSFHTYKTGLGYVSRTDGYIGPQTGDPFRYFDAPVYLPTGALLNSTIAFVYDNDASAYVRVFVWAKSCSFSTGCTSTALMDQQTAAADTPGYTFLNDSSAGGTTWKNYDQAAGTANYITARVYFSTDSTDLRLGPVYIWYQRQVSPAPASATFSDVPTSHWAFQYVEALVSSGITGGCGGGNYCPTDPVNRAQMAVFLATALGLDYPDFR